MDLPIRMRIFCKVKHRHTIRFKFGDTFLISLTKLVLEAEAGICPSIKIKLFCYCNFLAFVIVVKKHCM